MLRGNYLSAGKRTLSSEGWGLLLWSLRSVLELSERCELERWSREGERRTCQPSWEQTTELFEQQPSLRAIAELGAYERALSISEGGLDQPSERTLFL